MELHSKSAFLLEPCLECLASFWEIGALVGRVVGIQIFLKFYLCQIMKCYLSRSQGGKPGLKLFFHGAGLMNSVEAARHFLSAVQLDGSPCFEKGEAS